MRSLNAQSSDPDSDETTETLRYAENGATIIFSMKIEVMTLRPVASERHDKPLLFPRILSLFPQFPTLKRPHTVNVPFHSAVDSVQETQDAPSMTKLIKHPGASSDSERPTAQRMRKLSLLGINSLVEPFEYFEGKHPYKNRFSNQLHLEHLEHIESISMTAKRPQAATSPTSYKLALRKGCDVRRGYHHKKWPNSL